MGMTWSEYKIYRQKKKREEQSKKEDDENKAINNKQTSIPSTYKRTIQPSATQTISNNNKLANNIMTNITGQKTNLQSVNLTKKEELKNQKLERIYDDGSTWGNIVKFFRNAGRAIDNLKEGAKNGIIGAGQSTIRDVSDVENFSSNVSRKIINKIFSSLGDKGKVTNMFVDASVKSMQNKRNEDRRQDLEDLQDIKNANTKNIQKNIFDANMNKDPIGTKLTELAPSMGQQLPGYAMNAVLPGSSLLYFKLSSEANYYDDAKERGMTEGQSKVYSKLMSWVEAGTEQLSVENIQKGGQTIKALSSGTKNAGLKNGLKAGIDVFKETAKEETANSLKEGLKNYGIGIAEEAFQEAITEPIQEFTAMKVAGEDKADWNNMWQRMLQSGFDGALSSAIIAGANMGVSSCQGIVTKIENGQEISNQEYNKAVKDASKKVDIEKLATDGIKNEVNKLKSEMLQNQATDNKVINQEQKTSQNGFSEAEKTETLRQEARNKLESIKQNYDENSYNQMQEFIETAPSEKALNQVISDLNKEAETKQVAPLKQKQEVQLPMKQQETQNKSFEDIAFEAMNNYESNEVESPLKNRDMDSIGKQTKVNAYQYDNPKVKPYFQEMAQQMGEDLAYISSSDNRSTQKGGGTKLSATTKAMDILHNEQGYSYNQIAQGLQNIIDDKGSENNAISKKIELVIDEQLRNGYTNALGKNIEPNQEYMNTITEQYSLAEQPQQNNFKYEQSNNAKVDTFRQDASKYWDNSEKTTKLVNTIEKVINDKGYNIRLNDTIGDNVNGKIVTNQETGEIEITINPNSSRAGEFILGHELTHAIQTQEMVDLINQRMQKDGNLRNAVEDLKKLYNTNEVNAEVLADISGQLFGNQEFINNLSVEKPNVFKRIYDKIVSLANKITGNSSEALFIKDLKNKWEKAYRENNNTINEEQYSIETDAKGYKYVKADRQVISGNNPEVWKTQTQNYIDEQIRKNKDVKVYAQDGTELTITKNTSGKATFRNEVRQADGTIRKLTDEEFASKLRAETHIDELGEVSKHKNGPVPDTKNHSFAKDGFNYRTAYFEDEDGQYYKITMSVGKNGDINTIYNVGKMQQAQKNRSKSTNSELKGSNGSDTANSRIASNNSIPQTQENVNSDTTNYSMQESENNSGSFNLSENHKEQQNKIIQENNPMDKALGEHTWINSADDIKTYQEAIEEFGGIDNITPDFTADDVKKALDTGKMTVYSSYPIEQGTFVTPSKMEAQSYAGKSQVYSKEVSLSDVAWIDEVQGQYANVNEKYSKQNNNWQDYLESNYKSEGTTTDLRDIRLPMKEKQEVKAPLKQQEQTSAKIAQVQNNNTKGEIINWNEIERPEENRKFRKHYKSIIESDNTTAEAKSIAKDLMGTDTYVPETNKGQLAQADQRIMTSSPEVELQALRSRVLNGERITSVDIAVGERLIQYFSKTGSAEQLQDAIQTTALAGTSTGQTLQALTILNHQTPQGQVTWLQRSIDKMNKELAKKKGGTITTDADGNIQIVNKQGKDITNKVDLFNLTPEMMNKIMQSENQEQMLQNIDEVYEELGQQVPKSMIEKIDTWRYFSMLANARTHIRNMVGNVAMGKMQRVKDKIAGGIEGVVSQFNPNMERTKTLARADKKTKNFAKQDFKNMEVQSRLELNENKYNPQSRLQNARRTFKSDVMENTLGRLFNLNDTLLEAEDGLGLKAGYQKALADYLTANKIDVDNITDAQLNKARNYAIQQAKEATFHQANALANLVNQLGTKNKVGKFIVDATLPFKKTPMNVAKSGIEYSPVGLLKSAIFDTANLRKGNISINQYIDNVSKGLTGSGVALVGYALAKAGIIKASGSDDKDKEKYDEEQGRQSYSIQIAGKTYSLDWLAPTGIPLFIGAEINNLENQQGNEKNSEKKTTEDWKDIVGKSIANITNAGATAINPMSEMSMISGITSVLSSYNKDNALGDMATNMGKSYINQFVPTVLGQVAKTTDDYERTTKSTKTGTFEKALDQTVNQIKNKVPGLRQTLPIKTDIWGNDVKQEVNLPLRAVNNFINPATVKEVSTDKVDMELNKLYEENHSSSLLPDILTKTVQLNKQTYRLSNKEYAEFTKKYGQTSHKLIENFIKTSDYNRLTQEQKETAISNIYSYAKEQNKLDYAKKVGEEVKESTLYTTMKAIEKGGGKQSEYLNYLAKTKGMSKESEKNKVLADSNYSNKTKEIIYTNGTGKDDNLYNDLLSKSNIDMTEYLKYKDKLSSKAFSADKDKNGKTIAGSAKTKVINYLNNNITGFGNRLLIAGNSYALQNSEKQKLAEYINSTVSTREERLEIYKQLDKNFTIKDGKVYMRVSK